MGPALKTLIFSVVAPGGLGRRRPWLLVHGRVGIEPGAIALAGLALVVLGAACYAVCALDFVVTGRGTPAPLDPPQTLVARRPLPLRQKPHVRRGAAGIVSARPIALHSATLLVYALMIALLFHLFVIPLRRARAARAIRPVLRRVLRRRSPLASGCPSHGRCGLRYTRKQMGAGINRTASARLAESRGRSGSASPSSPARSSGFTKQHVRAVPHPRPPPSSSRSAPSGWPASSARWLRRRDRPRREPGRLPQRDAGEPLVAVTAHLDTVLAPRNKDENRRGCEGILRGPGVSDNGAGPRRPARHRPRARERPDHPGSGAARLVLIANVGEEGEGNSSGMRHLAGQFAASRLVSVPGWCSTALRSSASPTRPLATAASRSCSPAPAAHSWSDSATANPVHALSHAISWFTDQFPPACHGARNSRIGASVRAGRPAGRADLLDTSAR